MAHKVSNFLTSCRVHLDNCWNNPSKPGKVEKTISQLALSMIKASAMTAFTTATTVGFGIVAFFSLAPSYFGTQNSSILLAAANITNIVSPLLLGIGIAQNKKMLISAALIALSVGCSIVLFYLQSDVKVFYMMIMGLLNIISLIASLVIKACHSEKLALKNFAAQLFCVLGMTLMGSLRGSVLLAPLAILGAIISILAKRYDYTTISKIASTISVVSFMCSLSECFSMFDVPAKAVVTAIFAAIAAAVTIIHKGNVSKTIRDFITTFLGSSLISLSLRLTDKTLLRGNPLMINMFLAFGSVARRMSQNS